MIPPVLSYVPFLLSRSLLALFHVVQSLFREWSQKALEEEEKRKKEKKMNQQQQQQQQQQHQQQQQQLANGDRAVVDSNGNANQNIPNAEENGAKKVELPVVTKPLKKNFASMDCGAKVLSANSEAQSPGNVISPHKDEYLLNKARKRSHSQEQFLFEYIINLSFSLLVRTQGLVCCRVVREHQGAKDGARQL